jgi:UDP-N-acetylglucosamine--N-acetylmuramyl-(pentapeptide) pyrophosphoryl-undecaprenol N-acetylglucosamine transferase
MATLLVSSVGGHLTQLCRLAPSLQGIDPELKWVTFDSPQSRSMLRDEDVIYLEYTRSRDVKQVLRHSRVARRLLHGRHPFSTMVSTGSGVALSFLPLGRMRGVSCHYIESFTRTSGPSVTGRLMSHVPGVSLYAQYESWAKPPWVYAGSVFDTFASAPPAYRTREIRRAVVTLGTMEKYSFRRLIEQALAVLPGSAEVLWQVGCTDVSGLPISARSLMPAHELSAAIAEADVVIAHAGTGSAVAALEVGKKPVLVPRLAAHGENIDDHQVLLARELARRELAIVCAVDALSLETLELAARSSVSSETRLAPFKLVD